MNDALRYGLMVLALLLSAGNLALYLRARKDAFTYYNRKGVLKKFSGRGWLVLSIVWFVDAILWLISALIS